MGAERAKSMLGVMGTRLGSIEREEFMKSRAMRIVTIDDISL